MGKGKTHESRADSKSLPWEGSLQLVLQEPSNQQNRLPVPPSHLFDRSVRCSRATPCPRRGHRSAGGTSSSPSRPAPQASGAAEARRRVTSIEAIFFKMRKFQFEGINHTRPSGFPSPFTNFLNCYVQPNELLCQIHSCGS